MSALVSIITRTKDRPLLLPRACDSVLAQTTTNWEHIIVNDTGDPEPVEAIVSAQAARYGGRVRILHRTASTGMESASNAGIQISTGRYLVIHDDDDSWHPQFLEKTTAYLEHQPPDSRTQGVVCHTTRIVENLTAAGACETLRHPFTDGLQPLRLWRVLEENAFPPICFLFRRSAWDALGPFDETLPVLGDWEFNVRFLRHFEIAVIPEMLAFYHHRADHSAAIYANTVTAHDHLHRATEERLIERWAASDAEPTLQALASAARGARKNLILRRENDAVRKTISTLQAHIATIESRNT